MGNTYSLKKMKEFKIDSASMPEELSQKIHEEYESRFDSNYIDKENYEIIFKEKECSKIVYHYTTVDAFFKIFDKFNAEKQTFALRAGHAKYMNDPDEISRSIFIFKKALDDFEEKNLGDTDLYFGKKKQISESLLNRIFANQFILSFSKCMDSLPMWSTYCNKGRGIAIGIEVNNQNNWIDCTYNDNDFKMDCLKILEDGLYDSMMPKGIFRLQFNGLEDIDRIRKLFLQSKHPAYRYEQERRFIHNPIKADMQRDKIFDSNSVMIKEYSNVNFSVESLREIWIGPSLNQDMIQSSVWKYFGHKGIRTNNFEYRLSDVPFRIL